MLTFLALLISMQCFVLAQRQAGGGLGRGVLMTLGFAGLGAGFALSAYANGLERGAAVWLASLMAAGFMAPFLANQIARLPAAMQWSRMRVLVLIGRRLQASFK